MVIPEPEIPVDISTFHDKLLDFPKNKLRIKNVTESMILDFIDFVPTTSDLKSFEHVKNDSTKSLKRHRQ